MATALLLAASLFAAEPPEKSLLQSRPDKALLNEILELKPAAGHHFEPKAPSRCGKEKALELTPRKFRCQLARPGETELAVSVCDDAKTFCVPETLWVFVQAPPGGKGRVRPGPVEGRMAAKAGKPPIPGFHMSEPGAAQKRAREEKKPLFIHFGAIWCPPCNMLEELVYPAPEFRKAAEGLVLEALDADAPVSWGTKTHFKVGGYPTLILADADLNELGRVVGYRGSARLAEWLEKTRSLRPVEEDLALLRDESALPPARLAGARKRVGLWRYERGEYAEASRLLSGRPDVEARKHELLAVKALAKQADDKATLTKALKTLVEELPDEVEHVLWLADLAELDAAFVRERLALARSNVEAWAASEKLDSTGWVAGDLYGTLAELLVELGREAEARPYYAKAADDFERFASRSKLELSRGPNLERGYYLWKSGRIEDARKLYDSLTAKYPEEFTFNYQYAKMLSGLKENERAYELARRAESAAYGDNWLRAVHLKAKLESALGRKGESRETLESALAQAVLPRSTDVRTHRYLAQLRELLASLAP